MTPRPRRVTSLALSAATFIALIALPAVSWATGGEGGHDDNTAFLTTAAWQLLNLAILLGAGYYFGRMGLTRFLRERKERVSKELDEAQRLHAEARRQLEDYRKKIDSIDLEREKILNDYKAMGQKERERIITEAQAQADKITRDAQLTVESEIKRARAALEGEVVTLAASMAESAIRQEMNRDTQRRLVDAFLTNLEGQARPSAR